MSSFDPVNNPKHYLSHPSGVECIDITEHLSFNVGNAIKYLWRAGLKSPNATEDLKKAGWYVGREVSRLNPGKASPEHELARELDELRRDKYQLELIFSLLNSSGTEGLLAYVKPSVAKHNRWTRLALEEAMAAEARIVEATLAHQDPLAP